MIDFIHQAVRKFLEDQDGLLRCRASALAASGSFIIDVTNSSPFIGENTGISVRWGSETGFTGVTDIKREVFWTIDFDDTGATFPVTGGGKRGHDSAEVAWSRAANKVWNTSGSKTVTISAYKAGGILLAQQTVPITVIDPDTHSWDVTIYVDPTGVFSGIPADNGTTIRRISTWTEVDNWSSYWVVPADVRVVCVDGTSLSTTSSGSPSLNVGDTGMIFIHNQSYGGASRHSWSIESPGNESSGSVSTWLSTAVNSTNAPGKIIWCGVDVNLNFDMQANDILPRNIFFLHGPPSSNPNGLTKVVRSFAHSELKGAWNVVETSQPLPCEVFFYGMDMGDNSDYCHVHFEGDLTVMDNGCRMMANPQAVSGDGKNARTPTLPDHAISWRRHVWDLIASTNCDFAAVAGWSGSTIKAEDPPQAACRANDPNEGAQLYITDCRAAGNFLIVTADVGDPATDWIAHNPVAYVIDRCLYLGKRWSDSFFNVQIGNVTAINNIIWLPEIWSNVFTSNQGFFIANYGNNGNNVQIGAGQSFVEYNTVFSDRSGTLSGNDTFEEGRFSASWTGDPYNFNNNAVEIPGHTNAGSYPSLGSYSRGDLFKPITGNSAINGSGVNDIRPAVDYDGNFRPAIGTATNRGAHDTSVASDLAVTAVANTTAPTVNTYTWAPGEHYMDNGVWTGIDDNARIGVLGRHLWLRDYEVNGVSSGNKPGRYAESVTGVTSGILTGRVAYVGLGGQVVWADVSNSIDLAAA